MAVKKLLILNQVEMILSLSGSKKKKKIFAELVIEVSLQKLTILAH